MKTRPLDYDASSSIEVGHREDVWTIHGRNRVVTLQTTTLRLSVSSGDRDWITLGSSEGDLVVEQSGQRLSLSLASARQNDVSLYTTGFKAGVKIDLGRFVYDGGELDLRLQLLVCLESGTEDLICEVASVEGRCSVKELLWPRSFEPDSFDSVVVPYMQGMLLPKEWPDTVALYDRMAYSRGLYMPWWGYQKGNSAAMVILETPDDAGCGFAHPAGGPTVADVRWVHSLGDLRYSRRARLSFVDEGNYVDLAKRYRRYVIENGHFVSLDHKIARSPVVGDLIGAPIVHTIVLKEPRPGSRSYVEQNPEANRALTTFDECAADLSELARRGVRQACVHVDGWGFRGYDSLHPDIVPPSPAAGGWGGMRRLADVCQDLGYLFIIHDNYRDYYLDAESYQDRHTLIDENGDRPCESIWYGGKNSILCPTLAPGYLRRNIQAMLDERVDVHGAYLDVFSVLPGDECYNPEHPATRSDCLKYRAQCLDLVRAKLGVVSSEEPGDWAIPYLDLVHHGPYPAVEEAGFSRTMGYPVPLFSLVYHDAIIVPWNAECNDGGWGIPSEDTGFLHCMLNAGMPYISMTPDESEMACARVICDLHRRVGRLEMTRHEFLDSARRKQRTTFADGTTVTVDFDSGDWTVGPESCTELVEGITPVVSGHLAGEKQVPA